MLSILIPVYRFDVRAFIGQLSQMTQALEVEVEILVLDDASGDDFQQINKVVGELPNVRYSEVSNNLGRSAVRNRLVETARFEHLLFLDCDGTCPDDQYLQRYLNAMDNYDVIYGGRVYNDEAPDDHDLYFHWYCGSNREAILVEERKLDPYKTFMTNNFLIRKEVYESIQMDERVSGYGHEDTLFAQELKRRKFVIEHIDNPIEHLGLEAFDEFMGKSRNAVRNLAQLMNAQQLDDSVKLIRYYQRLKGLGLLPLVSHLVRVFESNIMNNLQGPAPNLLWFDLWKLKELRHQMRQQR